MSVAEQSVDPDLDQRVYLRGVTWAQYEALDAMRGESALPRITYLRGVVELMSPGRSHERIKTTIGRLLEAWAFERGIRLYGYGSWTLKSEREDRAAEADECYVVAAPGQDPESKEWPDLAIEVVWTSGGIDKLDVYRKLNVGEVWFWKRGKITVHVLQGTEYREVDQSLVLPDVDLALIARLADHDQHDAVRELLELLRGQPGS
jgi:Uma2 family endonuclease